MDATTTDSRSPLSQLLAELMPGRVGPLLKEAPQVTTTTTSRDYIVAQDAQPSTVELTVAADVGNATTGVLVQAGDGKPVLVEMSTVRSLDVVNAQDVFDRRGLSANAWGKLSTDDHIVEQGGIERFLGQLAVDFARAQSSGRGSDNLYSDGTTTEFVLAAIAAAQPKESRFAVRLATLLPISLWPIHAERAEKHSRQTWQYGYNGRQILAKVDTAKAYREGEAAYYGLPKKPAGRAIIVDGGGRTVNVALFSDGIYRDGRTIDNMGVETALDALDRQLEVEQLRRLTIGERIELQARMRNGVAFSIMHRQMYHRIDQKARRIFDATARTLVQELARLFQMEAAEGGAFIGGAAYPEFFGRSFTPPMA